MFYQAFQTVRGELQSAPELGLPTVVVFLYMRDMIQSRTKLDRNSVQKVAEIEYRVMSRDVFTQCARYRLSERLAYFWMAFRCSGGGVLLYVVLGTIRFWYAVGVFFADP